MGLLGLLGQSEGRILRYWVDPVNGNNANAGTQAAPFKELRYASSTAITTARRTGDIVYIYCAPETYTTAEDYFRLDAVDWAGGKLVIRCSVPGQRFTVANTTPIALVQAYTTSTAIVDLDDVDFTGTQCLSWGGLTTESQTGVNLIVRENCIFTHSATTARDWVNFDSDAKRNSLQAYGCTINGWGSLAFINGGINCTINGVTFNAGSGLARTTTIVTGMVDITNSSLSWPNSANHVVNIRSTGSLLRFSDNTVTMVSTNAASPLYIIAPNTTDTGVVCEIKDNSIELSGDGPSLHVGTILNETLTRDGNNALVAQFASLEISGNSFVNTDNDGGCLRVMVGTNNAIVENNYCRRGVLGSGTNVHVVYLWGGGITADSNNVQGQLLAFGPNQTITNNVMVSDQVGILLGGTQGGSTTSGGGNNYTVTGNILVSQGVACFSDYAYNGAYPTNLGELVATVDSNTYVPISPGRAARLTDADVYCDDIPEILAVWQGGWGAASNETNDANSEVLSGADVTWHSDLITTNSGVLDAADFAAIRAYNA
jgi:hypothetical protein